MSLGLKSLPGKNNAKECKRALFTEPDWVLRRSLVGGCVLKSAWQEHSQKLRSMLLG